MFNIINVVLIGILCDMRRDACSFLLSLHTNPPK